MHYPLPNHVLYRIIWPEQVDAVCFIRKEGHYKNCVVFVTGSMLHPLPAEEETHQALLATAEKTLGITIEPAKLLAKKNPECEILYSKKRPANFWLSEHHLSPGQDISIRYGMRRERIDWRSSYPKLKQKRGFKLKYNHQQRAFLQLEHCNFLGIEMERLSIFQSPWAPDYPINQYRTVLFGDGTFQTYFTLKNWLLQRGGQLLEAHEHKVYRQCRIDFQDIVIRLAYPYRSFESYQSHGVTLTISNQRAYPDLLRIRPSERGMRIDQFIDLPEINLSHKYRESDLVRHLPEPIQAEFRDRCILWIDRQKEIIGLGDRTFANIIHLKDVEGFFVTNVSPARGPGWSQFGVVHRRYGDMNLFGSTFRKLDYLQSFIEKELQLPFENRDGGYDA
ncbi:MAG: hypothetical protein HRU41_29595 [Saprospiraceae bacterium]|nr:hypothetical protein [Saprospiraceae bacterium]